MPEDNDHDAWALGKKEKSATYMAKKHAAEAKAEPAAASASDKKKVAIKGKLALAKSFQSTPTTKIQCSDAEIKDIIDTAMKSCDSDADAELQK